MPSLRDNGDLAADDRAVGGNQCAVGVKQVERCAVGQVRALDGERAFAFGQRDGPDAVVKQGSRGAIVDGGGLGGTGDADQAPFVTGRILPREREARRGEGA